MNGRTPRPSGTATSVQTWRMEWKMKRKYLVLVLDGPHIGWLAECDTKVKAQADLDDYMASHPDCESGWVVETVGRNYTNT